MENKIRQAAIVGAGVLGSQISWHIAFKGYKVVLYDNDDKCIEMGKALHKKYENIYKTLGMPTDKIEECFSRIEYTTSLNDAIENADLISESVPEKLEIKREVLKEISKIMKPSAIITTNSSTIIPSLIADALDTPERFLGMHFANIIWKNNICEIMKHPGTLPELVDVIREFAISIGMNPIVINKEHSGYVLNSMVVPFLRAATDLYLNDIAGYKEIDRTWMISTGMDIGPFGIIDLVGMETVYNIRLLAAKNNQNTGAIAKNQLLKERFIDKGKTGIKSGAGFYTYPDPEYRSEGFLGQKAL